MRFRKNGESQNNLGRLDNTSDRLPVLIQHDFRFIIIDSNSRSDSKPPGHGRGPTSEVECLTQKFRFLYCRSATREHGLATLVGLLASQYYYVEACER